MYNEIYIPKVKEQEIPKGVSFCAKFLSAGLVGYKDGNYLLKQQSLDNFAPTLKGCPIIVGHQDISDKEDMLNKAVGYVANTKRGEDGCWFADFVVFDTKAIKKIEDGTLKYVSCGYRADLTSDGGDLNNVSYKKEIIDGKMLHLALVKNPRYNNTEIWHNSTDDTFVSEAEIINNKEIEMFGIFKKTKIELDNDADTFVVTPNGDKSIEQLVNELEEANKLVAEKDTKIAEQDEKISGLEAKVADADAKAVAEAEKAAEVEKSDSELKKDLNNDLSKDLNEKKNVIVVPTIN